VLVAGFLLTLQTLQVNLLAGSERCLLVRCLFPVTVGEIAWVLR